MKKHIPNLITCCNVLCGTLAIFMAMYGDLLTAASLVLAAMVFDFFDGYAARLLQVKSEMGRELDSLADVISFGVAPAILAHVLIKMTILSKARYSPESSFRWYEMVLMYSPILIAAFSAYRLAKFNLDTRQTYSFIGMPTPAHALFWVGLVFTYSYRGELFGLIWGNTWVLFAAVILLSWLLISEIPMFSLKSTSFAWKENQVRYLYFGLLIVLTLVFGGSIVSFVIPLYVVFALVDYLRLHLKR